MSKQKLSKAAKRWNEKHILELKAAYLRCRGAVKRNGSIDGSLISEGVHALCDFENCFAEKPGKPTLQPGVPAETRMMFDALWGLVYGA